MDSLKTMLDFIEDAINNYACFEQYRGCSECPIVDLDCSERCGTALREVLEELIYND